jgi:NTE family protein
MARTRVAIACQGGGSQTAFTAGALKVLIDERPELADEFELVSISGTSGGALCAALVWYGELKGDHPPYRRLMAFWKENTAQGWAEEMFNDAIIAGMRMINAGLLPSFQMSPASPVAQRMMAAATIGQRRTFSDFRALLEAHIDFAEIAAWGPRPQRPVLMVGAANVNTGGLAKFVSTQEAIRIEHILASCAVPNIFGAVQIGEHSYWDGLFSDNPPIQELIRPRSVGVDNVPEEVWLIKINPTGRARTPVNTDEILDRRNQLEGNISLFQQLSHIEWINDMIAFDALRPEFLAQFDIRRPIRIPKSFPTDQDKPYHIPCIEMPAAMQDTLDYEGKIDRGAANIDRLIAAGEAAARVFLEQRARVVAAPPPPMPLPIWMRSAPPASPG